MRKIWFLGSLLAGVLILACTKKGGSDSLETAIEDTLKVVQKMPSLISMKSKTSSETASWGTFKNFETEIKRLEEVKQEDISFVIDELINKEKLLSESDFPEKFNTPSVKSRIIVLKTYILQTKAAIDNREGIQSLNKQKMKIFNAYNALLGQLDETMEENIADDFLNQ